MLIAFLSVNGDAGKAVQILELIITSVTLPSLYRPLGEKLASIAPTISVRVLTAVSPLESSTNLSSSKSGLVCGKVIYCLHCYRLIIPSVPLARNELNVKILNSRIESGIVF